MSTDWIKADFVPGLVSVVVPLYNRKEYIVGTLDSVLASDYRPVEVIVIDDGSTDDSATVVEKWISQLPKDDNFCARLIEQPNGGPSSARNNGALASQGEFIHFLDADDMVAPVWYEYAVRTLQTHKDCGLVWAGWKSVQTANMKAAVEWCMQHDAKFSDGLEETNLPPYFWATLFRRSTLSTVGPQCVGIYPGEDTNFFLRVLMYKIRIRRLPCTLFAYRQFPEQASRGRNWKTVDSFLRAIELAETTRQELAFEIGSENLVRKQFAHAYKSVLFWCIVGKHKDLARRAGKGVRGHSSAFAPRHRVQIHLLQILAVCGLFRSASLISRLFYGDGVLKVGA